MENKGVNFEVVGSCMLLMGILMIALIFAFSSDGSRVTGNFIATGHDSNDLNSASENVSKKLASELNEQSGITSILSNPFNKMIAYCIFILIICIGVLLIVLSSWKRSKEDALPLKKKRKK
jgi:hypothetical protein